MKRHLEQRLKIDSFRINMNTKKPLKKAPINVIAGHWVQKGVTISHHPQSGKPIFIHGAIPGEEVRINIIKARSSHMFATVISVKVASPLRIDGCTAFPACGGCSFQHISYQDEVQTKKKLLLEWKVLAEVMESVDWEFFENSTKAYRNHVQVQYKDGKWGHFALHSNKLVEFPSEGCANISNELNELIKNTTVSKNDKYSFRQTQSNSMLVTTNETIQENIKLDEGNLEWNFPSRGFWQTNRFLVSTWANKIQQYISEMEKTDAVELFCGTGLLGGVVHKNLSTYHGYDNDVRSLKAGRSNFSDLKLDSKFMQINLYEKVPSFQKEWKLCIANPPRTGLTNDILHAINNSSVETLLYSSCNPATLNRDLKVLLESGFTVKKLDIFDFFPRTWHLEILILLERKNERTETT